MKGALSRSLFSLVALPALILAGALAAASGPDSKAGVRGASDPRPNFIVVMTDDQSLNTFNRQAMPRTFNQLVDRGTLFRNGLATPPLCCPARAAFLTGAYPHNNGVFSNNYKLMADKDQHIARWLRDAGYETGFVGKYLNKYEDVPETGGGYEPAPGWTYWWGTPVRPKYYDYEVSFWDPRRTPSRKILNFGTDPEDYLTTRTTEAALDFIETRSAEPFFLWVSYYAPHFSKSDHEQCGRKAPTPLMDDIDGYYQDRAITYERAPSYNEAKIRDKPPAVRNQPRLGKAEHRRIEQTFRCTVAAIREVDKGVQDIINKLGDEGIADRTVIAYLSDNGIYFGEHRKPKGKILPYRAAVNVPFAIRMPAKLRGGTYAPVVGDVVGTIDLAPTFMELAGLEGQERMDGRSLLPLLRGQRPKWSKQRRLLLEIGGGCKNYRAVRERGWQLTIWQRLTPNLRCRIYHRELYNLNRDPHMLDNMLVPKHKLTKVARRKRKVLTKKLEKLRICSGVPGRDVKLWKIPYC